ncbi:NrtA/SsuA/CpmA family ABC transporter substrate-binding protein [Lentisphaerota bacterium ZTH]|nr:NrtA/SsuA/CpmA family ABC transporter substrate-binding protein [Lentisphaerota bacterium]WET07564.1 NrtA/SsuA/CpmA family ABC transporter substrate-binding protein [Lentisphaerota bacterium ZTH]
MRALFLIVLLFATANIFGKEINISYAKSPFNLQLIVMKKKGLLEKEFSKDKIKINFHEITSGLKQAKALETGQIDICGVINTTSIIIATAQNIRIQMIRAVSKPVDIFSVMTAKKEINSIKDLKGKTVAGPPGTVLHQILLKALSKNGMDARDVKLIPMSISQASDAMLNGKVDAALLAASKMLKAEKKGAKILTTAKGLIIPKLVVGVKEDFLKKHPDWVRRYIKVQNQAMDFINNNKSEALQLGAEEHGISYEEAEQLYKMSHLANTLSNDDIDSLKEDIDFLLKNRLIPEKVSIIPWNAEANLYLVDLIKTQISICAVALK